MPSLPSWVFNLPGHMQPRNPFKVTVSLKASAHKKTRRRIARESRRRNRGH